MLILNDPPRESRRRSIPFPEPRSLLQVSRRHDIGSRRHATRRRVVYAITAAALSLLAFELFVIVFWRV